jgi:hypothetical protein
MRKDDDVGQLIQYCELKKEYGDQQKRHTPRPDSVGAHYALDRKKYHKLNRVAPDETEE